MKAYFTCSRNHGRAVGLFWGIVIILPFFMPLPAFTDGQVHLLWSWDVFGGAKSLADSSGLPIAQSAIDFLRVLFIFHLLGGPVCIAVSQIPRLGGRFILMAAASGIPAIVLTWMAWGIFEDIKALAMRGIGIIRLTGIDRIPTELDSFLDLGDYYFHPLFLAPICLMLILLWGWYRDNRNAIRFFLLFLSIVGVATVFFVPLKHHRSFSFLVMENTGGPFGWVNYLHFAPLVIAGLALTTIIRAALRWRRRRPSGGRLVAVIGLLALLLAPATIPVTTVNILVENYRDEMAQISQVQDFWLAANAMAFGSSLIFLPLVWFGALSRWLPFVFILGSAVNGLLCMRIGHQLTGE